MLFDLFNLVKCLFFIGGSYSNSVFPPTLSIEEENECVMKISFIGTDIDDFSPNKEIIVTYEEPELHKKYSGKYRILK